MGPLHPNSGGRDMGPESDINSNGSHGEMGYESPPDAEDHQAGMEAPVEGDGDEPMVNAEDPAMDMEIDQPVANADPEPNRHSPSFNQGAGERERAQTTKDYHPFLNGGFSFDLVSIELKENTYRDSL
jgi:hypothetical protein